MAKEHATAKEQTMDTQQVTENVTASEQAADASVIDDSMDDVSGAPESGGSQSSTEDSAPTEDSPSAEEAEDTEAELVKQQLLRLQADFDNYRKRTRQEHEELQRFATRKLLADLLPVADNFDRALSTFGIETDLETVRTGVEMVYRQLQSVLQACDVTPMEAVGQPFDPKVHDAVMQEEAGDRPVGVVAEELQKGYWLRDKVLRPAMVKVTV